MYENVFLGGKYGNDLYVRTFDNKTKKSIIKKVDGYFPPLYTSEKESLEPYTAYDTGETIYCHRFKNFFELREFQNSYNNLYGYLERRFNYIRENYKDTESCNHPFRTMFIDIETRSIGGFPDPELATQEVTVIQTYDTFNKVFIIFGLRDWTGTYNSRFGEVKYFKFNSEIELLENFIKLVQTSDPTIITGFNSNYFDIPYLINRMKNLNLDYTKLSPINEVNESERFIRLTNTKVKTFDIKGRFLEDYLDLIKKYAYLRTPSFSLENVSQCYGLSGKAKQESFTFASFDGKYTGKGYIELIKDLSLVPKDELKIWKLQRCIKKLANSANIANSLQTQQTQQTQQTCDNSLTSDNSQILANLQEMTEFCKDFKDILDILKSLKPLNEKLQDLARIYQQEIFNSFLDYGIRDVEVLLEIDEKAKLIDLAKTIAYISGCTLDDVRGTLKFWQSAMYNEAYKDKVILPLEQGYSPECLYLAGWVRSVPGKYKYVSSLDIGSAHPHGVVIFNIGPDTLLKEIPKELQEIRDKYFYFYNPEFYNKLPTNRNMNDIQEETDYILQLLENKDKFKDIFKKYNVTCTPNGFFYKKDKESYMSKVMRDGLNRRFKFKNEGKDIRKLQDIIEHLNKS